MFWDSYWRVETMAPLSLQPLFWLCLIPAPSGSYPFSKLISSNQLLMKHEVVMYCVRGIWMSLLLGFDDWFLYFTWVNTHLFGVLCCLSYLPSDLWFFPPHLSLLFCVSFALWSAPDQRLRLGPVGKHSPGSAWFLFMLVDILWCSYNLSLQGSFLLLKTFIG